VHFDEPLIAHPSSASFTFFSLFLSIFAWLSSLSYMRHVSVLSCYILSRRRCAWSITPVFTIYSRRRGQIWL